MKITNIKNVEKFFEVVDSCSGKVELVTGEGDRLNLKSKLCQIIGLSSVLSNPEIGEATIRCTNPEDETMLFRFNLYGKIDK